MNVATQDRTDMDDIVGVAPADNLPATRQGDNRFYREASSSPTLPTTGVANIATAIAMVMAEIGVVGEGGENKFQNYKYMSYKDMFRKLTPLMGKHGLAVIPTEKSKNLFDNDAVVMGTYQFTIVHKSGEVWPFQPEWTGVSRARDSKGGFDDKALNKCATAAQKYFLKALFQIPSGEDDEDPDNHDGVVPRQRSRDSAPPRRSTDAPQTTTRPSNEPPKPAEGPHKIVGGTYAGWADAYIDAIGTAGDPATVFAWVDANQQQLAKLTAGSPDDSARVKTATEKHPAFLRKTDPISSGPQASQEAQGSFPGDKPMNAEPQTETALRPRGRPPGAKKAPDFTKDYDGWIAFQIKRIAEADSVDALETINTESIDAVWEDILDIDRTAIREAISLAEDRLAP